GDRASPRPAIADRRGTGRADAPAARRPRRNAGTPSGIDSSPLAGGARRLGAAVPARARGREPGSPSAARSAPAPYATRLATIRAPPHSGPAADVPGSGTIGRAS